MRTKIISAVTLFILTLLCVLFLVVYLPRFFGLSVYYVEKDSMKPTLNVGDAVFTKKIKLEDIEKNDIITFGDTMGTKYCTHRVVEVNKKAGSVVTKGDNNSIRDPFETQYQYIKGKLVFKIPLLGYLFKILDTTAARAIAIFAAVIYAALEIELFRSKKKEGRQ